MNYTENGIWKEYYNETDPKKRLALYEKITSENEDDGADGLRKKLFNNRHFHKKKSVNEVDKGLWQLLSMQVDIKSGLNSVRASKKQLAETMKCFCLDDKANADEPGRSVIYWEIRNVAKRYLLTCSDPGYAKKLFGLVDSSQDEKQIRTVSDMYLMARDIPKRFGFKEELASFTDALEDELKAWSEEAWEDYMRLCASSENGD